jgi:hypothetical protein
MIRNFVGKLEHAGALGISLLFPQCKVVLPNIAIHVIYSIVKEEERIDKHIKSHVFQEDSEWLL